eukprot:COSAG06_NODE_70369_length_192_cov_43.451613_1_plen_23_part_01
MYKWNRKKTRFLTREEAGGILVA